MAKSPADMTDEEFEVYWAAEEAEWVARQEALEAFIAKGPHKFVAPFRYDRDDLAVFTPDLQKEGQWRATYLDDEGEPYGHRESETWEKLVRSLADDIKVEDATPLERAVRPNEMAPGYQSYGWTTQDWRVVVIDSDGTIDYADKCGAPSNSLPGGRKRLCLPAPVIKKLVRSKRGRDLLKKQARRKERAKPGSRVPWHPEIRDLWRELEAKTVEDRPRR